MAQRSTKTGRQPQATAKRSWRRRLMWGGLKWGAVGAIWSSFAALLFLGWCAFDLPDVSSLNEVKKQPSITLIAADGTLLASYGDLYGEFTHLDQMAGFLPAAVLATEDRRFYHHYGIDPVGLLRALYVNLTSGGLVQGGSTITQQLAKNVFLTPERSLHRKGQELLLSFWLEHNFTKNEILELYLNRVYFGSGTYGVDAAARRYFGHPAKDVTLLQAAMLAEDLTIWVRRLVWPLRLKTFVRMSIAMLSACARCHARIPLKSIMSGR